MKTEDIKKMAQAWLQVQEAGNCAPKMKKEELKGDQHKIDHNKDGKISAADFKGLRKKKKDQEVEVQTSEATVNELKKSTLSSYIKKASGNMAGKTAVQVAKVSSSNSKPDPDLKRGLVNRMKGIGRAADKLAKESVEEATHKPDVASPAGEGLSPSAKKELARKTPVPDAFDAPAVTKKSFDAMRASSKKAPMRSNDNAQGDKTAPKAK